MATTLSAKRLRKELIALQRDPVENITARPLESNILVWHYVLKGAKGSPYEGGYYHGKLKFPPEYPLKPPSIMMLTPSGRFKPSTRLCLSMSDFHPETWNPMWSVSTILMGLQAFMLDSAPTLGSIETSLGQKKKLAASSMAFNLTSPLFVQMFPEVVAEEEEMRRRRQEEGGREPRGEGGEGTAGKGVLGGLLGVVGEKEAEGGRGGGGGRRRWKREWGGA
ncbi:hypothetical protein NSK_008379 [Nannochloropsis salina CCMP1776]|uniref:E2 ubiquitin-conjugating enzyme n=1 Tax=Nannochloropsis salina CCMP1776 TaxID=1027361 RepID=A0A4D9CNC7_9STRA|nr:hypothetical protein NSK_008379 [Nannochloropsis salina CCMP1776]|eukprot:TFJ80236.1 hypothetical protein NSK_008379 [Nannochloropsis salina CCMP1776]